MYIRDTIAAISTPPGNGGIGIVRVSGDRAEAVCTVMFKPLNSGGLQSHRFYFGAVCDPASGELIDEAMAVLMRAPRSFTREDVLEIHCHGGMLVVERVLAAVLQCDGVRLADPGEFTRRAFLNGRIDLLQAEAVMDIISAKSQASLALAQRQREGALSSAIDKVRAAITKSLALVEAYIDFPEDDIGEADTAAIKTAAAASLGDVERLLAGYDEGRIVRDGVAVLIVGKPNAGKSSLLNRLLGENRAIVTHIAGTTRDIIEETAVLDGLAVRLLDTAGIRHTDDLVEKEGISRALECIPLADLVLFVLDASRPFTDEDRLILEAVAGKRIIAVRNKCDLPTQLVLPTECSVLPTVAVSAGNGNGIGQLKTAIRSAVLDEAVLDSREFVAISRARHRDALQETRSALQRFLSGLANGSELELLSIDLREALAAIGQVTGATTTDDVLDMIFSSFCIGK